jgi:hypothetical protein
MDKKATFKVVLCLSIPEDVKKKIPIKDVNKDMTIKTLKSNAELITGIPNHLQRLHYIDEG